MCDWNSTHIINNLNQFCDIEIRLKHKIGIFKNQTLKWNSDFSQTCINTKIRYLTLFWSILCMDRIQYTYKRYIYIFDIKFKISFVNYKTLNTWNRIIKISFLNIWSINVYRWNPIYIKPCKLILILSIHENHIYLYLKSKTG